MRHEAKPLFFCPGCNAAKVPQMGRRCSTVRGAVCSVRRCWRCAALNRGALRCGLCGAAQPLELVTTWVDLEEVHRFSTTKEAWPARRINIAVDRGGTGFVWVQANAWAQLRDSGYATRRVLEAALELEPRKLDIVGRYKLVRGVVADAEAMRQSWALSPQAPLRTMLATLDDRTVTLDVSDDMARPFADVKAPTSLVEVPVRDLLNALRLATRQVHNGIFGPYDLEVTEDRRTLTVVERIDRCAEQLVDMARRLIVDDRARLDLTDLDVHTLTQLVSREVGEGVHRFWSPAEVWGLAYCAGGACPGLEWHPDEKDPHPESCLKAGERGDDDVSLEPAFGSTYVVRGRRLALDLRHRSPFARGLAEFVHISEAEAARRDREGIERACPWMRQAG